MEAVTERLAPHDLGEESALWAYVFEHLVPSE